MRHSVFLVVVVVQALRPAALAAVVAVTVVVVADPFQPTMAVAVVAVVTSALQLQASQTSPDQQLETTAPSSSNGISQLTKIPQIKKPTRILVGFLF
ncbi:hypothetical protein D3C87_1287370 [compost metagenome]